MSDLQSFRGALATLQNQVDEMDALKASHYTDALEKDQDVWEKVSSRVSFNFLIYVLLLLRLIIFYQRSPLL